jgi:hypothetical protein
LLPSAEEATPPHDTLGALVCAQVTPESVEVKIGPPAPPPTTATKLLPSAEEATPPHDALGALVSVQFWANTGSTSLNSQAQAATASSRHFIFMTRMANV